MPEYDVVFKSGKFVISRLRKGVTEFWSDFGWGNTAEQFTTRGQAINKAQKLFSEESRSTLMECVRPRKH